MAYKTIVNINIVVDVMKALSDESLEGNLYLIDDGIYGSEGQGTGRLKTVCRPGDVIRWKACPVDLQAGFSILSISFGKDCAGQQKESPPAYLNTWEGIVPYASGGHHYRIVLQLGKGKDSVMSIDMPSLLIVPETLYKGNEKTEET